MKLQIFITQNKKIPKIDSPFLADIKFFLKNFKNKKLETAHLNSPQLAKQKIEILLINLPVRSQIKKLSLTQIEILALTISQTLKGKSYSQAQILSTLLSDQLVSQLYFAIHSNLYQYTEYLKKPAKLSKISFPNLKNSTLLKTQDKLLEALFYIRDQVNGPANKITPDFLSAEAKKIAKSSSRIKIKILDEKALLKNQLNLIAAVGQGSSQDSKLVILEYKAPKSNPKPILLVGKGVTFDSGGLNLKPTSHIETMKSDMAGASTLLGLFKLLAEFQPNTHIVALLPLVSNLISHKSFKPGDILTAYNKKTIEITNTDAEGRLILADSISYGLEKYSPRFLIDLATLTGASLFAVGNQYSALFTNSPNLLKEIKQANSQIPDKIWHLPITPYHRKKVKGTISDYKNHTSGVHEGASMAAAFLEKFVKKTPWIHLDIAGSAFYKEPINCYPQGATGRPLLLLYKFLIDTE